MAEQNVRIYDSLKHFGGRPGVRSPEPPLMSFIQAFSLSMVSQPPVPQVIEP